MVVAMLTANTIIAAMAGALRYPCRFEKPKGPWLAEPFAQYRGLGDNTVTRYSILAPGDR
jgi:hypothetical protein